MLWILYNDQPPNQQVSFNNGHTKGAVIVNSDKGFWLIHSVPRFPPEPNTGEKPPTRSSKTESETKNGDAKEIPKGGYAYPSSGKVNGQSFLCISTNKDNANTIGKQLMYNQIVVYQRNLPSDLSNKFNVLVDAANQVRIKKAPFNNKINLYSTNGMEFTSFAKSSKWQKGIYKIIIILNITRNIYESILFFRSI